MQVPLPAELDDGGAEVAAAILEDEAVEHAGHVEVAVLGQTPATARAVRERAKLTDGGSR